MGAVMGTFSSLQTKQRRPSKGKTCFAFPIPSVYLLGGKFILARKWTCATCERASNVYVRCNLQGRVGCEVVEETCGHEEIAVEGFGGMKSIWNVVIRCTGVYEEEKLGGSICRALAEETCLFLNPMLCKPFEEGIKCRYTANSS